MYIEDERSARMVCYHNFMFLGTRKIYQKECEKLRQWESVSRHVPKRYELCNDSHYIFVHNWGELQENNKMNWNESNWGVLEYWRENQQQTRNAKFA